MSGYAPGANAVQQAQIRKALREGKSVKQVSDEFRIVESCVESFVEEFEEPPEPPEMPKTDPTKVKTPFDKLKGK